MKPLVLFALVVTLPLAGCEKRETTGTASSKFTTPIKMDPKEYAAKSVGEKISILGGMEPDYGILESIHGHAYGIENDNLTKPEITVRDFIVFQTSGGNGLDCMLESEDGLQMIYRGYDAHLELKSTNYCKFLGDLIGLLEEFGVQRPEKLPEPHDVELFFNDDDELLESFGEEREAEFRKRLDPIDKAFWESYMNKDCDNYHRVKAYVLKNRSKFQEHPDS